MPEKLFERFCEGSGKVKWFYKNGDKGAEYFSIVYTDNFGKQKSFYPDYVVGIGIALIRPIIPLQALKYVAAVCIFAIMHILGVLLESVAQMYLTFWRNR